MIEKLGFGRQLIENRSGFAAQSHRKQLKAYATHFVTQSR